MPSNDARLRGKVEILPLDLVRPNAWNPNRVPEHVMESIRHGFRVDGWLVSQALLVWATDEIETPQNMIIDGEHRWRCARDVGLREGPMVRLYGLSLREAKALTIKLNQKRGDWSENDLARVLAELATEGEILSVDYGFAPDEIDALLALGAEGVNLSETSVEVEAPTSEDDERELPTEPITQPGDLWILGEHRILCGDCNRPEAVREALGDLSPDLLLTDPPYCSGGFQESGKRAGSVGTTTADLVVNDRLSTRGYVALMRNAISNVNPRIVSIFCDWRMWSHLYDVTESCGFGVRSMVVWDKNQLGLGMGWRPQHELVLVAVRTPQPFDPHASRGNVYQCKRTGNVNHPTEKPVDLLVRILEVTSFAKIVVDAFLGSGSTLIACEQAKRTCVGIEMDPRYCDVAVARWEKLTGRKAEHHAGATA